MKLSRFLAPLDACLHPDAPLDDTLLLDQATSSGVAPVDGFVFNSGDSEWMVARDRERLRRIEVAEVNKEWSGSGSFCGVRDDLIIDENGVYWRCRAVELGDDGEDISSRTNVDARETLFGRGLDCSWALTGCCGGLLRPGLVLEYLNIKTI
ncbi:hypothetical protein QYE76_056856 [Lolium multiflorum]|uniref:Uncharacterized protein n=1 Tax=Lolium multiflorum TaxID=4521 RepID=A0AAD8T2C6_LOLMU|nr:hypothetical protein QYE76_056856 [Lolium multiflorum]